MTFIKRVFTKEANSVSMAAMIIAISSGISALLGMLRDRLLASSFGAGQELDAYFSAFRIPDFIYSIVVVGGLTAAFLPVFSEYREKGTASKEWSDESLVFVNSTLNCFLLILVGLCFVLSFFSSLVVKWVAPGFNSEQQSIVASLVRIMFLSPVFFGISNIVSGILQYHNRFLSYSLAPIFYNLGIISGILFFVPLFGLSGLAYGVVFGSLLHLLIQAPSLFFSGFRYKLSFDFKNSGLRKVFRLMVPRLFGQATYQVNLLVITAVASTFGAGSIAIFSLTNNIQAFPVSMIGVSFAIASFPLLASSWSQGQINSFLDSFASSFRKIVFLVLPLTSLLFVFREDVVTLILGSGRFDSADIQLAASCLGFFSLGIVANSLIPLVSRGFFSVKDTKTPVVIGVISLLLNFLFLFLFSRIWQGDLRVLSLPLSLSLSSSVQFLLLMGFFVKKITQTTERSWLVKDLIFSIGRTGTASLFSAVSGLLTRGLFKVVSLNAFGEMVFGLLISGTIALVVCLAVLMIFKSPELEILKVFLRNERKNP